MPLTRCTNGYKAVYNDCMHYALNNVVTSNMLLKESIDIENYHIDMVLLHEEEQPNVRLKERQHAEEHTHRNPKKHIPSVS